ncbi:hypothetical protein OEZ60_06395 [Defluviimonas sp. WL0024]|uniref:HK97 gp10 family phage protein n=2 Tax=Albidovulum TaxID=205889 RepID=A0ABT3J2M8_9RHOB|nr:MULTISPECIES: hypothetical protein [Defluviimonas]MCU9847632.1 hypothetical protein [Defluviimonas sp. WL0024]MCW3781940.1 hypothetical protein [Defluviimonas salinarum]
MTVSNQLIDRLSSEAGRRLNETARAGRRRALGSISRCCVTVTTDGTTMREEFFDVTPTIGEISARVGGGAYVVSIAMRRKPLRERIRLMLAAE